MNSKNNIKKEIESEVEATKRQSLKSSIADFLDHAILHKQGAEEMLSYLKALEPRGTVKVILHELMTENELFRDDIKRILIKMDKAFVTNTDTFLAHMKEDDQNKYYRSNIFMQETKSGIIPINFPKGTLSYIGAMTHRGKTTALVSITADAIAQGLKVYYITTEESPDQIITRLIKAYVFMFYPEVLQMNHLTQEYFLSDTDDIDNRIALIMHEYKEDLFNGLTDVEAQSFENAVIFAYNKIRALMQSEGLMIIDHTMQRTFEELEESLDLVDDKSLVIVDYVQHLKTPAQSGSDNRQVVIQKESQALADISTHKRLIIISGAQFNRTGNKKDKEADKYNADFLDLSLFRESGDIEQDANIVVGIGQQVFKKEVLKGKKIGRFYEILKYRGHAPDTNKYEICDNTMFSMFRPLFDKMKKHLGLYGKEDVEEKDTSRYEKDYEN